MQGSLPGGRSRKPAGGLPYFFTHSLKVLDFGGVGGAAGAEVVSDGESIFLFFAIVELAAGRTE